MKYFSLVSSLTILALSISIANAKPVVEAKNFKSQLAKKEGPKGMFAPHDNFPKDYFLVPKNIPFLVNLTLHHPNSSDLNLTPEQINKIKDIKKVTVPVVIKHAQAIKKLELELVQNIAIKNMKPKTQYDLLEKIAQSRLELTKKHLDCVHKVRAILNDKQFKILQNYASKLPNK